MDIGIGTADSASTAIVAAAFVAILAVNMLMLLLRWPQLMSALAGPRIDHIGTMVARPEGPKPVPARPALRAGQAARRPMLNPATRPALAA